jgi:hypothetical protein
MLGVKLVSCNPEQAILSVVLRPSSFFTFYFEEVSTSSFRSEEERQLMLPLSFLPAHPLYKFLSQVNSTYLNLISFISSPSMGFIV